MAGNRKGVPNKRLARVEGQLRANGCKTPLEILLNIANANDEKISPSLRVQAAAAAAPYVHRKMPHQLEHSGPQNGPIPLNVVIVPAKEIK